VFDAIGSALKRGDEVRLVGFGTFSCSKRKASTGRNPRTGEPMQIKESTQPKFKAGKGLKDSVNADRGGCGRAPLFSGPQCWTASGGRLRAASSPPSGAAAGVGA
jgi:DNA-binding protein HU-beta